MISSIYSNSRSLKINTRTGSIPAWTISFNTRVTESVYEAANRNGVANVGSNPITGAILMPDDSLLYRRAGSKFSSLKVGTQVEIKLSKAY